MTESEVDPVTWEGEIIMGYGDQGRFHGRSEIPAQPRGLGRNWAVIKEAIQNVK